ncbi:hypothetical protein [Halorarius halobius]|uniref:hypothetical protein n=1 Tax=Halorarius halobius TaxID=2962671 RepID=UPI0020CE0070|nr:hypothetical protein [Halorarius halobius]
MDISRTTLKRAGQLVGYFVLGLVGTGAIALGLLYVFQPIQTVIYDLVYLSARRESDNASTIHRRWQA